MIRICSHLQDWDYIFIFILTQTFCKVYWKTCRIVSPALVQVPNELYILSIFAQVQIWFSLLHQAVKSVRHQHLIISVWIGSLTMLNSSVSALRTELMAPSFATFTHRRLADGNCLWLKLNEMRRTKGDNWGFQFPKREINKGEESLNKHP